LDGAAADARALGGFQGDAAANVLASEAQRVEALAQAIEELSG
jgi:hypothetical protein